MAKIEWGNELWEFEKFVAAGFLVFGLVAISVAAIAGKNPDEASKLLIGGFIFAGGGGAFRLYAHVIDSKFAKPGGGR